MNRKAVALIFSFVVAAVLATLGSAVISRSVSERYTAQRYLKSRQSFWLAEAGIQRALWELNYGDGNWAGWTDTSGDKSISVTLSSVGDYYVDVVNPGSSNPQITSIGYTPSISDTNRISRGLEADIVLGVSSPFRYAAFGDTSVFISGNGKTDSYDSGNGAYADTNVGTNGDIATNGTTADVITLKGNAIIKGDAGTGAGGTVRLKGNAAIEGEVTHDTDESLSSVEVPITLEGLSSSGSCTVSGNNNSSLSSGAYKFSSIAVSGNGQLTLEGPMEIYLTEAAASALGISGNARINVNGQVKIYTEGKCSIAGNGIANNSNLPENFIIYSKYSSASDGVQIAGNADLYGAIYAPDAKVSVSGNGDIFGSVVADQVNISGNGDVHYDEALSSVGSGSSGSYVIGTWKEETNSYTIVP